MKRISLCWNTECTPLLDGWHFQTSTFLRLGLRVRSLRIPVLLHELGLALTTSRFPGAARRQSLFKATQQIRVCGLVRMLNWGGNRGSCSVS